jgi:hypothetical protein
VLRRRAGPVAGSSNSIVSSPTAWLESLHGEWGDGQWLRDSDPALRWQVERDLLGEPPEVWEATRARVATEGFGARLLALQDPDGQWAGGAFFPADFDFDGPEAADDAGQPWTATTWSLDSLREWGLDPAILRGRRTAELLAEHSRWEYDDLPYWGGEVDCCINAYTLANGLWLGADVGGTSTGWSNTGCPMAAGTARGSRARSGRRSTRR